MIYLIHGFKKKSMNGIATPKSDIDLIKNRLKIVAEIEKDNYHGKYKNH